MHYLHFRNRRSEKLQEVKYVKVRSGAAVLL